MTQKTVKFVFIIKEHIPVIERDDICTIDNCLVIECSQG